MSTAAPIPLPRNATRSLAFGATYEPLPTLPTELIAAGLPLLMYGIGREPSDSSAPLGILYDCSPYVARLIHNLGYTLA